MSYLATTLTVILISDTPGARILSHRQNIQPYGPLLAIQPISRALVP
jgi:hypothetical protein